MHDCFARGVSRVRASCTVPRLRVRPLASHNEDLNSLNSLNSRGSTRTADGPFCSFFSVTENLTPVCVSAIEIVYSAPYNLSVSRCYCCFQWVSLNSLNGFNTPPSSSLLQMLQALHWGPNTRTLTIYIGGQAREHSPYGYPDNDSYFNNPPLQRLHT